MQGRTKKRESDTTPPKLYLDLSGGWGYDGLTPPPPKRHPISIKATVGRYPQFSLPRLSHKTVYPLDQGYGRGVPPIFTAGSKPPARVTLYFTDVNTLGGLFSAA